VSHHSSLWRTECAYPLQTRPSPNKQPQALDCCESSQLSLAHGVRLTALPTSPPFLTSHFSLLTSHLPCSGRNANVSQSACTSTILAVSPSKSGEPSVPEPASQSEPARPTYQFPPHKRRQPMRSKGYTTEPRPGSQLPPLRQRPPAEGVTPRQKHFQCSLFPLAVLPPRQFAAGQESSSLSIRETT
jgi:hypothetical protein